MLFIHKIDDKQIEVDILDDDSIEIAKYKLSTRLNCNINDICDLNDWYPAVSTPDSRLSLVISGENQARNWIKQYKDNTLLPISE